MNKNKLLKISIKFFFWIFTIYISGVTLLILFTLPFVISEKTYDIYGIINASIHIFSSIGILILSYFYIYRHKFLSTNKDLTLRIILFCFYFLPIFIINIIDPSDTNLGTLVKNTTFILETIRGTLFLFLLLYPQKIIILFQSKKDK